MKITSILTMLLFVSGFAFTQDIKVLDQKKGFKSIKLNSSVSNYNAKLKYTYDDGSELYYITNYNGLEGVGDSEVELIELVAVDGKIVLIEVFFLPDGMLREVLVKAFGEPTSKDSETEEGFNWEIDVWKGESVMLEYQYGAPLKKKDEPQMVLVYELKDVDKLIEEHVDHAVDDL